MRPTTWSKCCICPTCNAQPHSHCVAVKGGYRRAVRMHKERLEAGRKLARELAGDALLAGPGWRNQHTQGFGPTPETVRLVARR